ncbi:MAG: hypothetical protein BWK80_34150, partial [Desulfobacteraceae bacterium IS3]
TVLKFLNICKKPLRFIFALRIYETFRSTEFHSSRLKAVLRTSAGFSHPAKSEKGAIYASVCC